jgi:ferrous iron transport protein B
LIQEFINGKQALFLTNKDIYRFNDEETVVSRYLMDMNQINNPYRAKLIAHHHDWLNHINAAQRIQIKSIIGENNFLNLKLQINETFSRFSNFSTVVKNTLITNEARQHNLTDKIDRIVTNRFWGPFIFFFIMLMVFQAIYSWAEYPMSWIENGFAILGDFTKDNLPTAWYADLLVDGVIAGLAGVLVFIPQITILFFLITALEELGYMSRAVFMFDGIMQRFGMNGRSIVALVSSGACAIPAIMSTRTISNVKERIITILVSPLISCSARIPVYTALVGFVVPKKNVLGLFNGQGLVFMALYVISIFAALISAFVFKKILKTNDASFLLIELPRYKPPIIRNVLLTVREKVLAFIFSAGKIILFISVILWFLANYGPSSAMQEAETLAQKIAVENNLDAGATSNLMAAKKIEASYAGLIGKFIEPAIIPLGFDWKIGIALITSFAAREVFVGTMATIYSIGNTDDETTIREQMAKELRAGTTTKMYTPPTAISLLLFYLFAMQCMSTLAVTKRETNSWKWPVIQLFFMTTMAYIASLTAYQLLS